MRRAPQSGVETPRWLVVSVMLVVVTIWGAAFSGIKVVLGEIGPTELTSARLFISAITFTAFLPFVSRSRMRPTRSEWLRFVAMGFLGGLGYHLAINVGETYVTAGTASLVVASMPAMVAVASRVVFGEHLGFSRALGVGIAFGGVALLTIATGQQLGASNTIGVFICLIAPACWAAYTIICKPLAKKFDPVRLQLVGAWVGAALASPFGVRGLGDLTALSGNGIGWLLYLGILSTAATYVAYVWALKHWSASSVASFVYLVPVISLVWAAVILGEKPSALALVSGGIVIIGVVLVQRTRPLTQSPAVETPPLESVRQHPN